MIKVDLDEMDYAESSTANPSAFLLKVSLMDFPKYKSEHHIK